MSLDNSILMEIYPYAGFLAYLKFWFIDGITKQSLMLLDKTRVDYDTKGEKKEVVIKSEKTESQFHGMLKKFGFNPKDDEEEELTKEQRAEQILTELEQ